MTTPLDLSKLPESIRRRVQERLDKLPPEMRQEFMEKGAPIIDRAIERVSHAPAPATMPKPTIFNGDGRYNATVQPGDRIHLSLTMLAMIVAAVVALYWLYGH